jgi:hypothetical protein
VAHPLGHGPVEWHAFAGSFPQGFAIGCDGLFEPRRPALPLAEDSERSAQQTERFSTLIAIARRGQHAPRHLSRHLKREIDSLVHPLRTECVKPKKTIFRRPGGIAICRIHGRDVLDPSGHGGGIAA